MLALTLIPSAPRVARADGPIIDADVQSLMDEKPDEEHALIVSVELCRTPLNIEELLPTPEEVNECTRLWRAWEILVEEFEEGCNENLTQEMVGAAYAEAKAHDAAIVAIQKTAYRAYHEDYSQIVAESVVPAMHHLGILFGDRVRWIDVTSELIAARVDRSGFDRLRELPFLARVIDDISMAPMLDKSHRNIEAHKVHNGEGGVGPYTGAGVKVAIVDQGIAPAHPRLPTIPLADQEDFVESGGPNSHCEVGHGTGIAGVIACQPDGQDGLIGIAYGASLVIAKVAAAQGILRCSTCPNCLAQTWSIDMEAFLWATSIQGPHATIVNFSQGLHLTDGDVNTLAGHITALNVDWLVASRSISFVHSAGNIGQCAELSPPSGAYNLVSVGQYDDKGSEDRLLSEIYGTCPGPTDDGRRKPDLCAPGKAINTTYAFGVPPGCAWSYQFHDFSGTSFAAPHVAGITALLSESRPSLLPRQVHALLINTTDWALLPGGTERQTTWHDMGGWGMANAYRAVLQRNYLHDGSLAGPTSSATAYLSSVPAGEEIVITGVWHRAMLSATNPLRDAAGNASPANLDLILEARPLAGGVWSVVDSTIATYSGIDGLLEDNVRQVRSSQPQTPLSFRVRVEHNPTQDVPYQGTQSFSLASRHAFAPGEP